MKEQLQSIHTSLATTWIVEMRLLPTILCAATLISASPVVGAGEFPVGKLLGSRDISTQCTKVPEDPDVESCSEVSHVYVAAVPTLTDVTVWNQTVTYYRYLPFGQIGSTAVTYRKLARASPDSRGAILRGENAAGGTIFEFDSSLFSSDTRMHCRRLRGTTLVSKADVLKAVGWNGSVAESDVYVYQTVTGWITAPEAAYVKLKLYSPRTIGGVAYKAGTYLVFLYRDYDYGGSLIRSQLQYYSGDVVAAADATIEKFNALNAQTKAMLMLPDAASFTVGLGRSLLATDTVSTYLNTSRYSSMTFATATVYAVSAGLSILGQTNVTPALYESFITASGKYESAKHAYVRATEALAGGMYSAGSATQVPSLTCPAL
jgi:hypothetical protein